jgi:hypothetical protein
MHALLFDEHIVLLPILLNRMEYGQSPGISRETGIVLIALGMSRWQVIPFLARLLAPAAADALGQINQHTFLLI